MAEAGFGPLEGVRVLELGSSIGGAFCGKLLAGYGATVIKVEPPGGDPTRRIGPFPTDTVDPEQSALFLYLNTAKRSVVADLDLAADRERVLALAGECDVVIESFAPGYIESIGLGWEALSDRQPALVLTSVTPFGQDGPYSGYAATNLTTLALGGQLGMTGDPDREPLKAGGFQAEYQAGLNALAATAIALVAAGREGAGVHLDIGAMQCIASTLEASLPLYAYLGRVAGQRRGNVMSSLIGLYPCADGYLGIHAMPRNWGPLAETMGMPELATDERFRTQRARMENNDELVALLYGWAAEQTKKEVYARAGTMRGPVAYVHTMEDLIQSPQLRARDYFRRIDHPVAGPLTYPGAPFSMSDSPWRAFRAPLLGEHQENLSLSTAPTAPREGSTERRGGRTRSALPLEGVRILDLTMVWAGPYATRLLGDMGAEVIKVESPTFWDLLRSLGYLPPDSERVWNKSAYFNHNNRDKLGVSLDLSQERGRALLLQLVGQCDVAIENYRADVLDRLGLGYETLWAAKEDIILVSMPGHGKSGPERDFIAYGTNVEQLAGLVSITGYEGGPPHKSGISYGDPTAGIAAAGAVALALVHRDRTGRGQYVELAQRENLTTLIGDEVVAYSMTGVLPEPIGNRDRVHAPHGVFPCDGDDSWVAIACTSDAAFAALCRAIGLPELASDPRYKEQAARKRHEADLDGTIATWTRQRSHAVAMAELQAAGVPAGAVLSIPELFIDPHLRAIGFWEQIAHPDAGIWDVDGVAWRLRGRRAHVRVPAPRFAEHNAYVYQHLLGLSEDAMQALRESGVCGETPDLSVHV